MHEQSLSLRRIFIFWVPLAATWLMMATEGPFLAAVIARLADPKFNLAAYGVAFAIAVFIEAPIIMMMSASTALVKDRNSYFKLRNFTYALNSITTLIMVIFILPPVSVLYLSCSQIKRWQNGAFTIYGSVAVKAALINSDFVFAASR